MPRRKGREGGGHTWCVTGGCSLPAKGPAKTWAAGSRAAAVGKAMFSRPNLVLGQAR